MDPDNITPEENTTAADQPEAPATRYYGKAVALVAAAGAGHRLGADKPKAFVELGEHTILQHCLLNIAASGVFEEIVVMASFEMCSLAIDQSTALELDIPVKVYPGGVLRSDSVFEGIKRIMANDENDPVSIIAVHDAARCLTPPKLFADVVEKTRLLMTVNNPGAVIPALPVTDTIKMVDSVGNVIGTPDRSRLRAIQTPQAFDAKLLSKIHEQAAAEDINTTDDAALFERFGITVMTVEGDRRAFKITNPEDLALANIYMNQDEND
ncbi:MAG: 2-C-methyl-D-erythritol 4-phosphate cytidylyltransferase [Lawsonella sp.]|nr:2-C-methyl-D-erythritol 4-phosphate cytidylyltransferase [Mycobacteriales bacterium]